MPLTPRPIRSQSPPANGSEGYGFGPADVSVNVWDYLRILVRHRWWMVGGFVVLATPVVAITMLTTPIYLATAKLLVAEQQGPSVNIAGPGSAAPQQSMDPRTQREVVRSRALARQVIDELRLWDTAEFGPLAQGSTDEEKANSLADAFLGRLFVDASVETRLLTIGFESADPVLAAKAANGVAARYIERDRESRLKVATDSTEWLTQRLNEQRLQVAKSEAALQQYRESRDANSLDGRQNIVVQKLGDLNIAVTRAKTERIGKETQFRQLESLKGDEAALEAHPLVSGSGFVQTLKAQLSELTRQEAQLAEKVRAAAPGDGAGPLGHRVDSRQAQRRSGARRRDLARRVQRGGVAGEQPGAGAQRAEDRGDLAGAQGRRVPRPSSVKRPAPGRCSTRCCSRPRKRRSRAESSAPASGWSTRPRRRPCRSVRARPRPTPRRCCSAWSAPSASPSPARTCGRRSTRPTTSRRRWGCRCWR